MSHTDLRLSSEQLAKDGLWLGELDDLCYQGDKSSSGPWLSLSVAIKNVCGWLDDPRVYDGRHRNKWLFALRDFQATADRLGTKLKVALEPEYSRALTALGTLNPPRKGPYPRTGPSRTNALARLRELLLKAGTSEAVVAAWRDLADGCKDQAMTTDGLGFISCLTWDLARLHGADVNDLGIRSTLSGVMIDDALSIAQARADLGDCDYPKYEEIVEYKDNKAGLTIDERLVICDRLLSSTIIETENIVWFGVERASLNKAILDYGPIQFHESEWLCGNLFENGPSKGELPPELISADSHISKYDMPRGKNILAVRVDVGYRSRVGAVREAQELLEGILTLAVHAATDWKIIHGYSHFVDGRLRTTSSFMNAERRDILGDYSWRFDPTQSEIERLKTEFTPIIVPRSNPQLSAALEARKWLKDVADADSLTRTLTYVWAIERVASWVNGGGLTWYDFASMHVKEGWVLNNFQDEIRDVTYEALNEIYRFDKKVVKQIEPLRTGVIESLDNGFRMYLDKAVAVIPRLAIIYETLPDSRAVKSLATKVKDGTSVGSEFDDLCDNFDLLLNRLIACRDSAQHGGPINDDCVKSVVDFAEYIARLALWTAIGSLLKGDDIERTFVSKNDDVLQKHADLNAGANVTRLFT